MAQSQMLLSSLSGTDTSISSPSQSYTSPFLTARRWSHKKFGCRKRAPFKLAEPYHQGPRHQLGHPFFVGSSDAPGPGPSSGILSPGKEERKKKRRESDAKWRSNLSVCFKHLEAKALRPRNCLKSRLSKETIVQKTVQKVQYLEAVFMLLNQTDKQGRKSEFSPMKGHQNLQAARKEFAYKYHFKTRHREEKTSPSTQTKVDSPSHLKTDAVENPERLQEAVVPEDGHASTTHEQLVPLSVARTASETKETCAADQQDRDVPPSPTKSLICHEQDLSETTSSQSSRFITKNTILNRYINSGNFPQTNMKTSRLTQPMYSPPRTPRRSPSRYPTPLTPSFYSPVGLPGADSPAVKVEPDWLANEGHGDRVNPYWPSYFSGLDKAESPVRGRAMSRGRAASSRPPEKYPGGKRSSGLAAVSSPAKYSGAFVQLSSGRPSGTAAVSSKNSCLTNSHLIPALAVSPARSRGTTASRCSRPLGRSLTTSPLRSPATTLSKTSFHAQCWSPASSPVRFRDQTSHHLNRSEPSDLVMSSPSKRYKIIGSSITSLEDGKPETKESSQTDLEISLDDSGRLTPDLICDEDITHWKEDERSQKLTPCYATPHSVHISSRPPGVPVKKRPENWSARFINDVRDSRCQEDQPPPASSAKTKSKRRKRLFSEDSERVIGGACLPVKNKKENVSAITSGVEKVKVRRKYNKRATAARIRPWDPVTNRVTSPVFGNSRQQSYPKKSQAESSSTPSTTKSCRGQRAAASSRGSTKDKTVAKMLANRRNNSQGSEAWSQGGSQGSSQGACGRTADLDGDTNDILEVDVGSVDWPEECNRKTQADSGQPSLDKTNQVDQDSSQGSLLLSEIPQLPDDIITPLLLCGESEECFLGEFELERTLQSRYSRVDSESHCGATKSDEEIVLTILQLEEESRSGSSTRGSPDFIDGISAAAKAGKDVVDVMELVTPGQEGFPDHLQEALLRECSIVGVESDGVGRSPFMILSPARPSKFTNFERASLYLVSPVKRGTGDTSLDVELAEDPERECVEDDGDKISESMARFASSALALSKESINAHCRQSSYHNKEVLESSNEDSVYSGAAQTLLNGQLVGKPKTCFQLGSSYVPKSSLICIDSGTPSKNQPRLPLRSMPSTTTAELEGSRAITDNPHPYPTAATTFRASYPSTPPYLSSPSPVTPSTPAGYFSLGHLSQSTLEATLSPDLSEEAYRLSQPTTLIKQEPWDWTDPPPAMDLPQAGASLDDLIGETLLRRYYQTYNEGLVGEDASSGRNTGQTAIEVPDWYAADNDTSQSSQSDSTSTSSTATCSCTSSSQDSTLASSLPASDELQVVPSLSSPNGTNLAGSAVTDTGDDVIGHQLGF